MMILVRGVIARLENKLRNDPHEAAAVFRTAILQSRWSIHGWRTSMRNPWAGAKGRRPAFPH